MTKLTVAYIPEHFSTPMFLAEKHGFYAEEGLEIDFFPVIEGSGRLIKLLNEGTVDIAIGLTEAFVADVAKGNDAYTVAATYVESPLCWAISTGANRDDINCAADLAGKKIGVSRIGSGSYVMSFVLGLQNKFPTPYFEQFLVVENFQNLRDSVNLKFEKNGEPKHSDAFMWEHFTSKRYYDSGEIKRIGEIYTPWPSWVVSVGKSTFTNRRDNVSGFLRAVRKGVAHFLKNPEEAVEHISTHLDYTKEDAREWLKTVKFNESIGQLPIEWQRVVENTTEVLQTAGVIPDEASVNDRLKAQVVSLVE